MGEGHAAFFDILAPPYHTEVHEDEVEDLRECHFFSEISLPPNNNILILSNTDQNNSRQQPIPIPNNHKRPPPHSVTPVWLRRVKSPEDYFCDTEPYSMTQLLTHTIAHSTRPSFSPKNNNQLTKKFLILAVS